MAIMATGVNFETTLGEKDFVQFRDYFEKLSGVKLNDSKRALVQSRLMGRLRATGMVTFASYYKLLLSPSQLAERQMFVDVLTTHETRFYREGRHYDFLSEYLTQNKISKIRVWSAACSTGEEPYTLAMVLNEIPGLSFEIVASDISVSSMEQAKKGIYPADRCTELPSQLKSKYLSPEGTSFKVSDVIRRKVAFRQVNLMERLPVDIGTFDIIFLRNMLIYFDMPKQKQIVTGVLGALKPAGLLFVGHSEALLGIDLQIKSVKPSVYRKV